MKIQLSVSFILLSLLTLGGCSKAKKAEVQLEISLGALVGAASFKGGTLVLAKNEKTGEKQVIELTEPYSVTLPFGVWSLYVAAFDGLGAWQGPHLCGGIEKYDFTKDNQTVKIKVVAENCASEPYLSLIGSKAAMWDVAVWDKSNWQ